MQIHCYAKEQVLPEVLEVAPKFDSRTSYLLEDPIATDDSYVRTAWTIENCVIYLPILFSLVTHTVLTGLPNVGADGLIGNKFMIDIENHFFTPDFCSFKPVSVRPDSILELPCPTRILTFPNTSNSSDNVNRTGK